MQILRVELTKLHEPVAVLDSQLAVLKFHHALGPELFQGAIEGGNGEQSQRLLGQFSGGRVNALQKIIIE
jgi:hypothetical protein